MTTASSGTPDPRRWYTLGALLLALFAAIMGISAINVALPLIATSFSASFSDLQWITASYTLVAASLTILAVKVGDLYGRKRVFLAGVSAFMLGSLMCALAGGVPAMIAGRAVMGLGSAIITPVALAIVTVTFEGTELELAIGLTGVASVGMVFGPVIGGWLTQHFHWEALFWVNVGLGLVGFLGVVLFAHESREVTDHPHLDIAGAACSIGALFLLVLGLIKGQEWKWSGVRTLGSFAGAAVFLALFIVLELRIMRQGREPLMDLTPFRTLAFDIAMLATVVSMAAFSGFLFMLALLLEGPFGYDALGTGLRYMPLMVGFVLVAPLAGRLASRLGPRILYGAGFGLFAIGVLLLTRLSPTDGWVVLLPGLFVTGVGCAIALVETVLGAVEAAPPRLSTMASGASAMLRQVGGSLGVALFGSVLSNRYGDALPGALAHSGVPVGVATGFLASAGASIDAAGRLLPGLPTATAANIQRATHATFVAGFDDTARVVAAVLVLMLLVAIPVGRANLAQEQPVDGIDVA